MNTTSRIVLAIFIALAASTCEKERRSSRHSKDSDSTTIFPLSDTSPHVSSAREILLLDTVFTHEDGESESKLMGFSILVPADSLPYNWLQPVNFKDGTLYYRVSVLTKADTRPVKYQLGFQWNGGCGGNPYKEKFPSRDNLQFSQPGLYQAKQSLATCWEPDCQLASPIVWNRPDRFLVVLLNATNQILDDRWGYGAGVDNLNAYYPIRVHLQAVLVAAGDTLHSWDAYPITE